MIIKTDIPQMLANAENDLAEKVFKRDQLNIEIIQAQQNIRALRVLATQNAMAAQAHGVQQAVVGLTEAIRSVLRRRNTPMTAANVKSDLDFLGFNFAGFVNPSAAVHNTLKRMAGTNELAYDSRSKTYSIPRLNPAFYGG
jgi:hypothetical protein